MEGKKTFLLFCLTWGLIGVKKIRKREEWERGSKRKCNYGCKIPVLNIKYVDPGFCIRKQKR